MVERVRFLVLVHKNLLSDPLQQIIERLDKGLSWFGSSVFSVFSVFFLVEMQNISDNSLVDLPATT